LESQDTRLRQYDRKHSINSDRYKEVYQLSLR